MFGVDLYRRVRFAVYRDGLSQREVALRFGIDRRTVAKMLEHSAPPGYRRSAEPRRPKLEAHTGFIDQILFDDLDISCDCTNSAIVTLASNTVSNRNTLKFPTTTTRGVK